MPVRLMPVSAGKPIKLDKPVLLVGRNPDCDVVLKNSRKVSRIHCLIACVDNKVFVRDLGSTNGVWLNSHRVEREARMRVGDELSVADVRYQLLKVEKNNGLKDTPEGGTPRATPGDVPENAPDRSAPDRAERHRVSGLPLEAGQDVPMAIPEEDESFAVEASAPRLPRVSPGDAIGGHGERNRGGSSGPQNSEAAIPLLDDDSNDVIPLDIPSEDDAGGANADAGDNLFDSSDDDRPIIPLDD